MIYFLLLYQSIIKSKKFRLTTSTKNNKAHKIALNNKSPVGKVHELVEASAHVTY